MNRSEKNDGARTGSFQGKMLSLVPILIILVVVGLPFGLLVSAKFFGNEASKTVLPAPQETWAAVSAESGLDATSVKLDMQWADGASVLSPSWSGLVVAIAQSRDVVQNGDRVVKIDGIWRIGVYTSAPFYRSLGSGDSGTDVKMLNEVLRSLGYSANSGSNWSDATARGVRQFLIDQGSQVADVTKVRFEPGFFIWLPSESVPVAQIAAQVGAQAPAVGTPILIAPKLASSAKLKATDSQDSLGQRPAGEWVLRSGEVKVPYTGDPQMPVSDLSQLRNIVQPGAATATVSLERAHPANSWSVPIASVISGSGKTYCLYSRDKAGPKKTAILPVTLVGGSIATTRVTGNINEASEVLVNPGKTHPEVSCG